MKEVACKNSWAKKVCVVHKLCAWASHISTRHNMSDDSDDDNFGNYDDALIDDDCADDDDLLSAPGGDADGDDDPDDAGAAAAAAADEDDVPPSVCEFPLGQKHAKAMYELHPVKGDEDAGVCREPTEFVEVSTPERLGELQDPDFADSWPKGRELTEDFARPASLLITRGQHKPDDECTSFNWHVLVRVAGHGGADGTEDHRMPIKLPPKVYKDYTNTLRGYSGMENSRLFRMLSNDYNQKTLPPLLNGFKKFEKGTELKSAAIKPFKEPKKPREPKQSKDGSGVASKKRPDAPTADDGDGEDGGAKKRTTNDLFKMAAAAAAASNQAAETGTAAGEGSAQEAAVAEPDKDIKTTSSKQFFEKKAVAEKKIDKTSGGSEKKVEKPSMDKKADASSKKPFFKRNPLVNNPKTDTPAAAAAPLPPKKGDSTAKVSSNDPPGAVDPWFTRSSTLSDPSVMTESVDEKNTDKKRTQTAMKTHTMHIEYTAIFDGEDDFSVQIPPGAKKARVSVDFDF